MPSPRRSAPLRLTALEPREVPAVTVGLVRDINPGPDSGYPTGAVDAGGTLFFRANGGTTGNELWKSDGTEAGTVLLRDIFPGSNSSFPAGLTDVNGVVFFTADNGPNGRELWKTDGTADGTVLVRDIRPGVFGSNPSSLANVNGVLFFAANDGTNGTELWKSDGTAGGTVPVADIRTGAANSYPAQLTNVGGTLFFAANDGTNGFELWTSNGTAAGTVQVADINPAGGSSVADLTDFNGTLIFRADDGANGSELWTSNGTAAGTVQVADINSGSGSSTPFNFIRVGTTLFFRADDGVNGRELWKTDGTANGTVLVRDINPAGSGGAYGGVNVNGTLFFTANDGANGYELWKSDGTAAGTVLVRDINPGPNAAFPFFLTNANGALYFAANDGATGQELWTSDGTAAGTVLVADINPTSTYGGNAFGEGSFIRPAGSAVFLGVFDGVNGQELYALRQPAPVLAASFTTFSVIVGPSFRPGIPGSIFLHAEIRVTADGVPVSASSGTVRFFDAVTGELLGAFTNTAATLILSRPFGTYTFLATYEGDGGPATAGPITVVVSDILVGSPPPPAPPPPAAPPPPPNPVVLAEPGAIFVIDPLTGRQTSPPAPFGSFNTNVAVGDLTGDGVPDFAFVPDVGGGPVLNVVDGATGATLVNLFALPGADFRGGLSVAVGTGAAGPVVAVGAGAGGGPFVRLFDARTMTVTAEFFAFDPSLRTGVNVALGDVNGDGVDDVIVGTAGGVEAQVKVIDGTKLGMVDGNGLILDSALIGPAFLPFPGFSGGVFLAAGDFDGDAFGDVVVTPGQGGGPFYATYRGADLAARTVAPVVRPGLPDTSFRGGLGVAVTDVNGDGVEDVVLAPGAGGGPVLFGFDPVTGQQVLAATVGDPDSRTDKSVG